MPLAHAVFLGALLILTGFLGLLITAGLLPSVLGLAALVSYNALYTPLKKKTFFAMIPGSLCGMIVPAIGWSAARESLLDPVLWVLMTVFGLWQMAHFFIILMKNRHRMLNLPGAKRFANFFDLFTGIQMKLQTMIWTGLYALGILLFTLKAGSMQQHISLVMIVNPLVTWLLLFWIVFKKKEYTALAFAGINLSILIFMGTGIFNALAV